MRFENAKNMIWFFLFLFIFGTGIGAAEQNPVKGHLDDPVFIKMPRSISIDNKTSLRLVFRLDNKVCKKHYGKRYYSACRRNLKLAGKTVAHGIKIVPEIPGQWRWDYDYQLVFTPDIPWIAEQQYLVEFKPNVFPDQVVINTYQYKFRSKKLRVSIPKMKFFQDPDNPVRKVVATTLQINYPVDKKSLESRMAFSFKKRDSNANLVTEDSFPFEITYNASLTEATVTTALSLLPEKEKFLSLVIDKGVQPKGQQRPSQTIFQERVRVPGLADYYQVKSVNVSLVKNRQYGTDQTLTLSANIKTAPDEINSKLEVYLLPKRHPIEDKNPESGQPYAWQAANEVTDNILKGLQPLSLNPLPQPKDFSATHSFKLDTEPGRYLYVRLSKGVKSFGDFVLAETSNKVVRLPFYPKEIAFMQPGGLLALSGEKKISVMTRGLDAIVFEVSKVIPEFLNHLVTQTGGRFDSPYFNNWTFNSNNISEMATESVSLFREDDKTTQFSSFNFSPYLKDGSKGIFFLRAYGKRGNNPRVTQDTRFILITDLGFLVKQDAKGKREVFVQSLSTGNPVQNAKVRVLGKNGRTVYSSATDLEGRASVPNLKGMKADKVPVAIIVSKGNDLSFMAYDRRDRGLNYSGFPVSGTRSTQTGLKAFLFSDRGIYRPGDRINLGLIVKPGDWTKDIEGLPLELNIIDPRGIRIKKESIKLVPNGFQEYSFNTEEAFPTGRYHAHLYISNDGKRGSLLNSTSVRVEEFLPDRLKIRADFNVDRKAGWVSPDDLKATINLKNLYGTPATKRRVKGTLTLSPGFFAFSQYPDYQFFNALAFKAGSVSESLPDERTDQNGDAVFGLELDRFGKSSYFLNFRAEGFEAGGGRSVAVDAGLLVSPLDSVVGHKTVSNLSYLKNDREHTLEWIAVDASLKRISKNGLILNRIKKDYISTLVERNGKFAYESVPKERVMETRQVNIPAEGLTWLLDTTAPGDYVLVLTDSKGVDISRVDYSVAGEANLAGRLNTRAELNIKLDKSYYKAGEAIEMNIIAPYTGAGLITIESDRVYAHHWFKTDKTDTIQTITVPPDFEGNGFINVAFTRALGEREIYMSPLAYAVAPFTANIDKRRVGINLDVAKKARPGHPLPIRVSTDKPSRMVVFAVDEGILQVAQYKTPRPLDYFLKGRALDVETTQILDLLMPEFSIVRESMAFGGGMSAVGGKHLNPFRRKTDAPVVFWSGIVGADQSPQTLLYNVPSYFNGTLRVMAVAVGQEGVGAAEQKLTVKGDFVISPNTPVFAAPGDRFEVTATVANNLEGSGENANIPLTIELSEHLSFADPPASSLSVAEGREETIRFNVKVEHILGSAAINFRAGEGSSQTRYTSTLSVRPASPKATLLSSGYISQGEKTVPVTRERYPQFAETRASLSALPTGLIQGLIDFLDNNPFGCTEQTVSRAFSSFSLTGNPDFSFDDKKLASNLKQTIDRLRERQTTEGGFGDWTANGTASSFASVYAMDFLTQARDKGFPVPTDLTRRGRVYLKNMVNREVRSMDDARTKAYGIYILTRNGEITTNYITHLMSYISRHPKLEWDGDLTMVYLAASFQLMKQEDLAHSHLDKFNLKTPDSWPVYSYYNSFIKYSQYVVLLARHFPERLAEMDRSIIFKVANFIGEARYNTLSSSYAIQALNEYTRAVGEQENTSFTIEAKADDGKFVQLATPGAFVKRAETDEKTSAFRFKGTGQHGLFYQVTTIGFDKNLPDQTISQGMEITRVFQNLKGEPVTEGRLGEELEVVLTFHSHENKRIENVAVVDLLPGGFDLVLEKAGEGSSVTPDFVEKREDRIIVYLTVSPREKTFRYRIRPANKGQYTIPPTYAESMYDSRIKARGVAGTLHVN